MDLVLASTSPRRKELLAHIGLGRPEFCFTQVAPDIDETVQQGEAPRDYVRRLAAEKSPCWTGIMRRYVTACCIRF